MKNFYIAIRSLSKKGRHSGIKILSLGVGLAMGLVLIAKVCFELSYDGFYPASDRIYAIQENVSFKDNPLDTYPHVSGGIAPGMKAEIPGVEAATRALKFGDVVIHTPDKRKYDATLMLADDCFFDVLPRDMIAGKAKETLGRPLYALVSESVAKNIGAGETDIVGQTFEIEAYPGVSLTIGGVFKDVPKNTHLFYDMLVSMASYKEIAGWTNEDEWFGGDSYNAYALLRPGVSMEDMVKPMDDMLDRHVDPNELKEQGINYKLKLCPLEEVYGKSPETKKMAVILVAIASAILFAALMNYILLVISSLVVRSKDIAIHKCYGASGWNISDMIFSETFLNLLISLGISALLILAFREMVEELLNASLLSLISLDTIPMLVAICLVIFLLAGLLQSRLFAGVPVASVFRSYNESRRSWKKVLLFIQFIAVGFLICLLVVIGLQYQRLVTDDPGYSFDRLAYCSPSGVKSSQRRALMDELAKLPEVEGVASCANLPIYSGSGDMAYRPGTNETIVHFNDLYEADADYVPLMEMSVIEGKAFDRSYSDSAQVMMVSRMMADQLAKALDWKDGVIGKLVPVSGHGGNSQDFRIVGVYDDIRIGQIGQDLMYPSALFYGNRAHRNIVIKFHKLTAENMANVHDVIQKFLPDNEFTLASYSVSVTNLYNASRLFRNSVMWGGIVTLIITLIGLIGYINDETNRRGKEIAVRKINGATEVNILSLMTRDVAWMALPAILIGAAGSYYAGEKWLQQFSEKIPMHVGLFILCSVCILTVILATVVYRSWMVAVSNPVESLKSE